MDTRKTDMQRYRIRARVRVSEGAWATICASVTLDATQPPNVRHVEAIKLLRMRGFETDGLSLEPLAA